MKYNEYAKTMKTFFNQFANAYLRDYIPDNTQFPYLIYELPIPSSMQSNIVNVQIWDNSNSLKTIMNIIEKIEKVVEDGYSIKGETGGITLYKNDIFAQNFSGSKEGISKNIHGFLVSLEVRNY